MIPSRQIVFLWAVCCAPSAIATPVAAPGPAQTTVVVARRPQPTVFTIVARSSIAGQVADASTSPSRGPQGNGGGQRRPQQSADDETSGAPVKPTLDLRLPSVRPGVMHEPAHESVGTGPGTEDMVPVTIISAPGLPSDDSQPEVSARGLGAVIWAARHPMEAWRVLLPVPPHDGAGSTDEWRAECAPSPGLAAGVVTCLLPAPGL